MKKEWNVVEVLRHARHDWLNRVQLIKGYISLNNIERVNKILDEIIADAYQESKLSNMNMPEFASLLLVYNWEDHKIHLEYEILSEESGNGLAIDDNLLTRWTSTFLDILGSSVDDGVENCLSITIEMEDGGYRFFFDFRGRIIEEKAVFNYLHEHKHSSMVKKIHGFNPQEFTIELFLPYITVNE